jgi:hypothetical protein
MDGENANAAKRDDFRAGKADFLPSATREVKGES